MTSRIMAAVFVLVFSGCMAGKALTKLISPSPQEADFHQASSKVLAAASYVDEGQLLATTPETTPPQDEETDPFERTMRRMMWYAEHPDMAPHQKEGIFVRVQPDPPPMPRPQPRPVIVRASWYGPGFHGKRMANGQIFNMYDPTVVAHKTLPFGTQIEAENMKNGKRVNLVVQDRGPYIAGRDLDLSKQAAALLGIKPGTSRDEGLATVRIHIHPPPKRKKS